MPCRSRVESFHIRQLVRDALIHTSTARLPSNQQTAKLWQLKLRHHGFMTTLFEKIIAGELPGDFVHSDEHIVAIRDINPVAPVHILLIPRKPIPTVNDLTDEDDALVAHLFRVARRLAKSEGIAHDGYRLIFNCNEHGGQEVYHLHLHLIGGTRLSGMGAAR